jgi:MarR family transcriptional regulator, lower aerobic nicotinate degradation pathway regulator
MYNSETLEKALFERSERTRRSPDSGWVHLVRNTIYLVSSSAMPSMDRADRHLGELRDALAQISFTLMAVLTEVAAEHDLSLTQLRMLGILRDREPTMAELATFTGLERSTISGLIDRAAARGLVRRIADPHDGRSVRVTLTESARELVPEITGTVGDRIAPMTGRLNSAEQKRLTALLTKALDA